MIFNMSGGGGSDLNFSVIGSPTQPVAPKYNDIWVKTSVKISDWEFSEVNMPSHAMAEGFVYFTSTYNGAWAARESTGLNFLRKHAILTKLTAACQYYSGAWHSMDAYIYKSGAWAQFSWTTVWLYKSGVISDTLGGGMTPVAAHFSDTEGYKPTVTIGTSDIVVSGFTRYGSGAAYFNKPLDLTRWKTLYIRGRISGRDAYHAAFGLQKNTGSLLPMEVLVAQNVNWVETVHKIDVSGLSGMYYLGFGGHQYDGSETKCAISEIWVE